MTLEKIIKFAQQSIYDTAEYLGKWDGYDVYEPGFDDDKEHCLGFPQYILVKSDTIRWSEDWIESRAIRYPPSLDGYLFRTYLPSRMVIHGR